MKKEEKNKLVIFNQIYKELDTVYHTYAKSVGLSDAAFWILYSVTEEKRLFTQRDFCSDWSFPPQTVNSALKDLEKRGIIVLEPVTGNKKNKWIKLTKDGEELVKKNVFSLRKIENDSLESLSEEECNIMLDTTQKYVSTLRRKIVNNE